MCDPFSEKVPLLKTQQKVARCIISLRDSPPLRNRYHQGKTLKDFHAEINHLAELRRIRAGPWLLDSALDLQHALAEDLHQLLEGHGGAQQTLGSVLQHEGEELGEGQQAAGRHGAERVQVVLLHVQRVLPQLDAAFEVPRIGVDGSSVAYVVGRVRVRGSEDALSDQQRLHAHVVGVSDQAVQLLERVHLLAVVVGRHQLLGLVLQEHVVGVAVPQIHGSLPVLERSQQVSLFIHERGPQQLQSVDALRSPRLRVLREEVHDVGVARHAGGELRRHPVAVLLHGGAVLQQHLHDLQAPGLSAVV